MRIVIISDTHGDVSKVKRYLKENDHFFDEIWHLGDFMRDAEMLGVSLPTYAVRGNCDFGGRGFETLVRQIEGVKVFLCHGHQFHVKSNLMALYYQAVQENYNVVLFGHTHVPLNAREEGILFFNPGSASLPRAGYQSTLGILDIQGGKAVATHVQL